VRSLPYSSYNGPLAALRNGQIYLEHRHDTAHDEL
jgi:hypothetical protein